MLYYKIEKTNVEYEGSRLDKSKEMHMKQLKKGTSKEL